MARPKSMSEIAAFTDAAEALKKLASSFTLTSKVFADNLGKAIENTAKDFAVYKRNPMVLVDEDAEVDIQTHFDVMNTTMHGRLTVIELPKKEYVKVKSLANIRKLLREKR